MLRVLMTFWKNVFDSSDTNLSTDIIIFSLSSTIVLLLVILQFLEQIRCMFFQKVLLLVLFFQFYVTGDDFVLFFV